MSVAYLMCSPLQVLMKSWTWEKSVSKSGMFGMENFTNLEHKTKKQSVKQGDADTGLKLVTGNNTLSCDIEMKVHYLMVYFLAIFFRRRHAQLFNVKKNTLWHLISMDQYWSKARGLILE